MDSAYEAQDPQLVQLRGRSPLVLVPLVNADNAESMVAVAQTLAPRLVGKVLLLFVVKQPESWHIGEVPGQLQNAQVALSKSIIASFSAGLTPEALTTVAQDPWSEIMRVSRIYHCESILLGLSHLIESSTARPLENLISHLRSDVVVLRAKKGWQLSDVKKVLVPVGSLITHNRLRARMLSSLLRSNARQITYLRIVEEKASKEVYQRAELDMRKLCEDEIPCEARICIERNDRPGDVIIEQTTQNDLIILGLHKMGRKKAFGDILLRIAQETDCPLILIGQK